jgi:two-component system response regulator NreC
MDKLRVLLADDHGMMREGLRVLVNSQPDMEVVAEAADGGTAVTLTQAVHPHVVVMDLSMPGLNGLAATEQLRKSCPETRIVALTRHSDGSYLERLLRAGGAGYVLKKSASQELVRAIRSVAAGGLYVDQEMTQPLLDASIAKRAIARRGADRPLTAREEEVLRCTAWGHANKDIAERLSISVKTVEVHKANAMQKIGLKNRVEVVRYALSRGWLRDA